MKIIVLDLDNTIFDIRKLYKAGFGPHQQYVAPTTWDLTKCYSKEQAEKAIAAFKSPALYKMPLINSAYPYLLHNLRNFNQLRFVTTRKSDKKPVPYGDGYVPYALYETYRQLLANGIRCAYKEVILTEDDTKMDAVKATHADLVIDDSPIVIEACLANGIEHVMISTQDSTYNHYLRERAFWQKDLFGAVNEKIMK